MPTTLKKLGISIVIGALIFVTADVAQVRKRSICGKIILKSINVARTEVSLYFEDSSLLPGTVAESDDTFCIENFVSDLTKPKPARLYVASFCHLNDVTLVNVPFWPRLRRDSRFSGKRIILGPGERTNLGNVDVQITYGHVSLKILDPQHQPLLTHASDWSPIWIRVRDESGIAVHESGLSVAEIERAVDLGKSSIDLALPQGTWRIEIALGGVPPQTSAKLRAVRWLRVPGKLKIESCANPLEVAVSGQRMTSR